MIVLKTRSGKDEAVFKNSLKELKKSTFFDFLNFFYEEKLLFRETEESRIASEPGICDSQKKEPGFFFNHF